MAELTFEDIHALVKAFVKIVPQCETGEGHTVFDDGNYGDTFIYSLRHKLESQSSENWHFQTIAFLNLLLTFPYDSRVPPAYGADCPQCGVEVEFDQLPVTCEQCGYVLK